MPTVLAILADGFEEIEAITPIDLLRRAGAEVTIASLGDSTHVTGRSGITVHTETTLATIQLRNFDAVLLPGGPGVKNLRADARVAEVIRRHHGAGRIVSAICAAPTVLHDAGLLPQRYTAHFSVAAELPEIQTDQRAIADGHVVTSRGAGTALDFGLMLIEKLFSPAKAAEVAQSICA